MINDAISDTLAARVEQLSKKAGVRVTPQRLLVLNGLLNHAKAVGAYGLFETLKSSNPKLTSASVYRSLDFWVDLGVVHKVSGLNAYVACNDPHDEHTHLLMVCDACGKTIELCDHKAGFDAGQAASSQGFVQSPNQVIEFRGSCQDCQVT